MRFFAAISLFAASASAYLVLTPEANSTITKGTSVDITWSSVDTDASTFSVYLVNFVEWPPVVLSLAQNVPKDDGSIDLTIPCSVDSGAGWQFNFINGTNTYVIYAQSSTFTLTGDCVDSTTTTSISTVAPTTVTATATVFKNSTIINNSTVTATATATATTTATLIKTVETVVFPSPLVWFVQPSSAADATAVPQTITVYNSGTAPVTCAAVSFTAGSLPTKAASSGKYGNYTLPAGPKSSAIPSSSRSVAQPSATPSTTAIYFNAAPTLQVGGLLGLTAILAMLL